MISNNARETFSQTQADLRATFTADTTLVSQMPSLAGVRAVICICVAAFERQEETSLRHTLEELKKPHGEQWRAIIFCNWPTGETPDRCREIVLGCQNPNVHLVEAEVPRDTTIGTLRKMLHDAVSMQAEAEVIHITMDADTVWVHPDLVEGYLRKLSGEADACVGQLDWDNPAVPTTTVPALLVGQEMMRLLPKYGNKRIISNAREDSDILREAIFSRRSFGRGVQSNFAFTDSAYRRAGGYLDQPHDEFDSLLRRIWLSRFQLDCRFNAICFGWDVDSISVKSDSRRALWALEQAGKPPMRQWDDIPFLSRDRVRTSLPDMSGHRQVHIAEIEQAINLTLEAFNLPKRELTTAVQDALADIGLEASDYALDLSAYPGDTTLDIARVNIKKANGLIRWLNQQ